VATPGLYAQFTRPLTFSKVEGRGLAYDINPNSDLSSTHEYT